jgi:transcriptional regulator with XRE-family HTH domain
MEESMLKEIGRRIREHRQLAGYSQGELAEAFHCAQSRISAIENGTRDPGVDFLVWFSEKTGVSTDYILLGKETPRKEIVYEDIGDFIVQHSQRLMRAIARDPEFCREVEQVIKTESPIQMPGHYWLTADEFQIIKLARKNHTTYKQVLECLSMAVDGQ